MQVSTWRSAKALTVLMVLGILFLAAACSEGLVSKGNGTTDPNKIPEVSLGVLPPTDSAVSGTLEVSAVRGEGGFDVSVKAGPTTPTLDQMFLSVIFDGTSYQSQGVAVNPILTDNGILALAVEPTPGQIDLGLVATVETGPAVRPGDVLLSFKLLPGTSRSASSAGAIKLARARNLDFDQNSEGAWVLSWDYTNPGDTNQDGEVGLQDLTPIGMHYKEKVANTWSDPLRTVDGNGDCEINIGDITPIGMNYSLYLYAYKVQMSETGDSDFITVGELVLGEQQIEPGQTIRFNYTFGAQYVEGAWYRVVAQDRDLNLGPPSESISENGRRIDPVAVPPGSTVSVTIYAHNLQGQMAHANAIRVVFPEGYEYVKGSANAGAQGGACYDSDGIWSTFATSLLFPPDSFFITSSVGQGKLAIDFNVTTIDRTLQTAPVGYGDLLNFQIKNVGGGDLSLEFQEYSADGLHRTYYSDANFTDHSFGSALGFRVQ